MFESLYFLFFCVLIAFIIYWALKNDDQETFLNGPIKGAKESGKAEKK
ncbi:hypothetical protein [Kordiimonas sp.]